MECHLNNFLVNGVGHTIDFPNRNQILSTAYQWIDSVNCSNISVGIQNLDNDLTGFQSLYPSILNKGEYFTVIFNWATDDMVQIEFYTPDGKLANREQA